MSAWYHSLSMDRMVPVAAWIAGLGALVLVWYALAHYWPRARRGGRVRDVLLGVTAALSFACWFNFGHYQFEEHIHYYEFFHYFLGAKYFHELGYRRLYDCVVAAEIEIPGLRREYERLTVRDLATNHLETPPAILADPTRCTAEFTPERWRLFQRDADFFRRSMNWRSYTQALEDHGYNGTPVWGLSGGLIANLGGMTSARISVLSWIDPLLLVAMWLTVGWAFGWRALCAAVIFWGCNYPGRYWWTGGAFLRTDWLCLAVVGICLVKKERPLAGGFALAWATLLRIFPGFLVAALVAKMLAASLRARRLALTAAQRRFIVGGLLAVALLVPLATVNAGGLAAWRGFVDNSAKHLGTPLTNNMGLKTVVAWSEATTTARLRDGAFVDPFQRWKEARLRLAHERRPIYWALVLGYLVLATAAARKHPDWVALVLGVGLAFCAAQLTCYYWGVFFAFALLWPLVGWAPAAVAGLAWLTGVCATRTGYDDRCYFWISLAYLAAMTALAVALWRRPSSPRDPTS